MVVCVLRKPAGGDSGETGSIFHPISNPTAPRFARGRWITSPSTVNGRRQVSSAGGMTPAARDRQELFYSRQVARCRGFSGGTSVWLFQSPGRSALSDVRQPVRRDSTCACCASSGVLPTNLPLFSGLLRFRSRWAWIKPLHPGEHVLRRAVAVAPGELLYARRSRDRRGHPPATRCSRPDAPLSVVPNVRFALRLSR